MGQFALQRKYFIFNKKQTLNEILDVQKKRRDYTLHNVQILSGQNQRMSSNQVQRKVLD